MEKSSKIFGLLVAIAFTFSACGSSSDDPDYTLYDNTPLIGTYTGTLTAKVTDKLKPEVNQSAFIELMKATNSRELAFRTVQFGLADKKATDFQHADSDKAYSFTAPEYDTKNLLGEQIPEFIRTWFGGDYTSITKADIKLNSTKAVYTKATSTLKLVYTGQVTLYVTIVVDGKTTNKVETFKILCEYDVVQK